jgi:hypothetical protein
MSDAARYRQLAAKLHSTADRLSLKDNCKIFERITRTKAAILAKRADTASRWETMASTPLADRPGGFPGDAFNCQRKIKPRG